jgi:RHS repeat-associated protein
MLKDHLGSTRVVMNENNQAISSYDYDAWGNPMNSTVSEMSAYRYTGREYDDETGLHNFRARLYDSTLMRFYQVDPAEQFASPYVYCGNNPIKLIDPDGRLGKFAGSRSDRNQLFGILSSAPISTPLSMDKKGVVHTGSFIGPLSKWEQHFVGMLNDPDNLVIISMDDDGIGSDNKPIFGGVFDSIYESRSGIQANMRVYLPALQMYYEGGGCDVGSSLIHEFGEGYKGIELYALDRNASLEAIQQASHKSVIKNEPDQLYNDSQGFNFSIRIGSAQPMDNGNFLVPATWECWWGFNGNKSTWTVYDQELEVTGEELNEDW